MSQSPIQISIDSLSGLAPLYCMYDGQCQAQPAYITLSEAGRVTADYAGSDGTPMRVWHGLDRRYRINERIRLTALTEILAPGHEVHQLLQRIHDGHDDLWDGSNTVGTLDDDARDAEEQLERWLDTIDESMLIDVWTPSEYLRGGGAALDDVWPTGQTAEQAAEALEAEAESQGIAIDGDIKQALLDWAHELAQSVISALDDDDDAPNASTGITADHIAGLLAAGSISDDDAERLTRAITQMTRAGCYEANLVTDPGYYQPFVALGRDGRIYVGDCDNIATFVAVEDAIEHCRDAVLTGDALDRAQSAHEDDLRNNDAAEYCWHCDASLQIDALTRIKP